jgi:hypothetical protein
MTDKVQKIRAFLVGIADTDGVSTILARAIEKEILPYIDSLQEESVSEELNTESMIESYKQRLISQANGVKNSPLIDMCLASYKHGINETLDTLNLSNAQRTVKNRKEPVSEDLKEASRNYADNEEYGDDVYFAIKAAFEAGAKWQKEQMMAKSIEAVVSQVPCSNEIILYNPSSVDKYYLPQEMNKLGLNKGDKVKLIIIKED